jgi:HPt (histidine-containing phosphotransfer) domain-containing protein
MQNDVIAYTLPRQAHDVAWVHQTAILDQEVMDGLHALTACAPGMMETLIDSYFEDAPRALADMHGAIRGRDCRALAAAAHRLKGSSGIFGAKGLVHLCAALEGLGRTNELGEAAWRLSCIESAYVEVSRALNHERKRSEAASNVPRAIPGRS